jgi:hypothetical protein
MLPNDCVSDKERDVNVITGKSVQSMAFADALADDEFAEGKDNTRGDSCRKAF